MSCIQSLYETTDRIHRYFMTLFMCQEEDKNNLALNFNEYDFLSTVKGVCKHVVN